MQHCLAIQDLIQKNGLSKTVAELSLKTNEQNGLVQLNYNMIDSPRGNVACDECRGLILKMNTWDVVAYPFYRFYNEGEGPAVDVKSENATLQEKLDGSMMIQYSLNGVMRVATRGRVFANGNFDSSDKTFNDLFWCTWHEHKLKSDVVPDDVFLIYELVGPHNRILTRYDENCLYLIGARSALTLNELDKNELDELAKKIGVKRPREYTFNTRDDINKIMNDFKPTEEGFVLVDYTTLHNGSFNRIKIKNPRYLALKHLLGAGDEDLLNSKRLVVLIKSGNIDEVTTHFPEYKQQINEMKLRFVKLSVEITNKFNSIKHLSGDRKAFACEATKFKCPGALFSLLDNKVKNAYEFVIKMDEEKLLKLLS